MQNTGLAGVIFDLDGVLVTTDAFHYQAWKELADALGLDFNEEVNEQLRGVSREESLRLIYRHNNKELPDADTFRGYMGRKNTRYIELVCTMKHKDVLPGAVELLTALRKAGIRTAIASASKNTPLVLGRSGLSKYFDGVADGNTATKSKPDPEVFLLAAQKIGCFPTSCVGVEDAESGVEAIRRAGMVSVGIGRGGAKADYIADSVRQLDVDILRGVFSKHRSL